MYIDRILLVLDQKTKSNPKHMTCFKALILATFAGLEIYRVTALVFELSIFIRPLRYCHNNIAYLIWHKRYIT